MKLAKFFSTLLNRVLGTLPPEQVNATRAKAIRRDLESDPDLQRIAQLAGNERRTAAHRQSCLQGYDYKRQLVAQGKGHHTLTGTPAAASIQHPASSI
jgi:hypothetical protein